MKIYKPKKDVLVRVNFKKQGIKSEHLTLCECSSDEVYKLIYDTISNVGLSPFQKGKVTNVEIREATGSVNGKSISLSFKGLEPKETYNLILEKIKTITLQ